MIIHNPILTGSFTVNGTDVASITSSAASITAINAYTASQNILNGTYATTGSNTFAGIQTVNSNLVVTGSITAQTLVVQTVTSSVVYSSGSNVFGNNIANTQVFTGSMNLTGSLTVVTTGTEFQVTSTGVRIGNVIGDAHSITGSVGISGSATFASTLTTSGKITANGGGLLLDLNGGSDTFSRVTGNRGNGDNLHIANIEFYNSFSSRLVGEMRGITGAGGTQSNSGQLAFYTNNNGTYDERMRIYSEGQIGIKGAATTEAAYALFTNDANTGFFNIFAGGSGTATKGIKLKVTSGSSTIDAMTITSGGRVGIGSTAPDYKFVSYTAGNTASAGAMISADYYGPIIGTVQNSSGYYAFKVVSSLTNPSVNATGAVDLFVVRADGFVNVGTFTYNNAVSGRSMIVESGGGLGYLSSTKESKTNIENLSDISWLYQLNPVSFNYRKKDDDNNYTNEAENEKWYGLIADEVESVNQDLVFYNTKEDGTKQLAGVEYNKLIAALIKSSQELQAQITELKNK